MYQYTPNSNRYDSLVLHRSQDWDVIERFVGDRFAAHWRPLPVEIFRARKRGIFRAKTRGNFPSLIAYVPCFDEAALGALEELLDKDMEALPLQNESFRLFAINVLSLLDCIDYRKSRVERFSDDKTVKFITHYVFRSDVIHGHHMFKIREMPRGPVIVSEEFRSVVAKKRLKGLIFKELP
jgi:hypothetical protein